MSGHSKWANIKRKKGANDIDALAEHRQDQGQVIEHEADQQTDSHPNDSAQEPDTGTFHQEHGADMVQFAPQHLHNADLAGAFIDGHGHGIDDVDGRHQQRYCCHAAKYHLAAHHLFLHFFPLLVHGIGVFKAQVMDGLLHVRDILQIIHLHIHLVVGVGVVVGDLGHLVIGFGDHFQVLGTQNDVALGPPALAGVLLQMPHHFQFPAAGLFGGTLPRSDGQGHGILVHVHERFHLVALGIGHALPAVPFGAVFAFAGIVEIIAGIIAHQHLQLGGLAAGGAGVGPAARGQLESHGFHAEPYHKLQMQIFHQNNPPSFPAIR